jgi:hypothetical protein
MIEDNELGACKKDLNKMATKVRESRTRDKKPCLAYKNFKSHLLYHSSK